MSMPAPIALPSPGQPAPDDRAPGEAGEAGLAAVLPATGYRQGAVVGEFRGYRLATALQPIFSFSHQRPVGCEALVRAADATGRAVPPPILFGMFEKARDAVLLDRLCRTLHVANFQALDSVAWLFLNVNPRVIELGRRHGSFFKDLLDHFRLPPRQVVIEVIETAITRDEILGDMVAYYRDLGCMLAVDDFGAGHSNFDRIWRLEPEIVKLDRRMLTDAAASARVRRSLPKLVALLHEAGCIVLAEGIETDTEAMIALDAGVDLGQGYLFGRPTSISDPPSLDPGACERVTRAFRQRWLDEQRRSDADLAPRRALFDACAAELVAGADLNAIVDRLLALPGATRCYLLDENGAQVGRNYVPVLRLQPPDARLQPLATGAGANWCHRAYFRKAMIAPEQTHLTGPYLSLPDARMCTTLSRAMPTGDGTRVLCLDLAAGPLDDARPPRPARA